jgi:hypothetical protein
MKTHALLLLTALVVPLAAPSGPEAPRFHPSAGTIRLKNLEQENELELEKMTLEVNGSDMSEMAGQVEVAMKTTLKLSVADHYVAMGDGRPATLKRSFEEISGNTHVSQSTMMGDDEKDIPSSSELEGTTVVFTWDEDGAAFRTSYEEGDEGDEELLEDLVEDLDLRGMLPEGEVKEGDSWEMPAEAVRALLVPGGDVKLRPDESSGDPMGGMDQMSPTDMIGDLEGTFSATYRGVRDEDGVSVAVIELQIEAQSAQDLTERMSAMRDEMKKNLPDGMEVEISSFDSEFELEAEGELLWDVEAGLAHSLHVSGPVRMIVDVSMNMQMGDQDQAMVMSQTFVGNQTFTWTTGE